MISRINRFSGLGSVRPTQKYGQAVRADGFRIKYLVQPKRQYSRVSVIVSKKVSKKAVTRNRIRRRFYEAIKPQVADFSGTHDIVITVFDKELAEQDYKKLEGNLKQALKKASII